jgi:DNA-binding transcriptional regulator GbsR (MarR family)
MMKTKKGRSKIKTLNTLKVMNCNPRVKGKTINKGTCYTNDTIFKIKKAFNKNFPNRLILSQNPDEIIKDLSSQLSQCKNESCWLDQLSKEERKYLEKMSFSPKKPKEWEKNPREWLSNIDILNVLEQYEDAYDDFEFIGPTPIDFDTKIGNNCVWKDLCTFDIKKQINSGKNKIGIIFNLDKHDEGGSHWVSLFINIKQGFIFYFDSAANTIPNEITKLIKLILNQCYSEGVHMKYYTNLPNQHQKGNTECGMYSLYFIITMLETSPRQLKDKINLFKRKNIPDKFVESFRKKYFN